MPQCHVRTKCGLLLTRLEAHNAGLSLCRYCTLKPITQAMAQATMFAAGDSTGDAAFKTALPLDAGPVRVVQVERRADIEAVRSGLPITGMEQEVMEALLHSDVLVLCGETGCGKTTQVCHSCLAFDRPL